MRRFTIRLVATFVLSLGSVAHAGLGPNGLGPNGLGPNGLGPNGLGPNGLGPNGLGPNGLGPNGLGPNGLGPNGLGPNGLGPNGLDVNGLGPNGLGPNGLLGVTAIYLITPDGMTPTSEFKAWFEADPASASQYMRYFARCAYDSATAIAYLDSTGKTWAWTGQYGLAMTSLGTIETDPVLGEVRGRMTQDEGRWVSGCLLAHVNTKGTHQYLSVRPYGHRVPSAQAAIALATTAGERWTFAETFGAFFGDLFAVDALDQPAPVKFACSNGTGNPFRKKVENALGRTCDLEPCTYVDENGARQDILTAHVGMCGPEEDPADPVTGELPHTISRGGVAYEPFQVVGPYFVSFPRESLDVADCNGTSTPPAWCTAVDSRFTVPVDLLGGQRVECLDQECVGNTSNEFSEKLVGLVDGQAVDIVHSRPGADPALLDEAFTAIVRYTKGRTGAANLWVSTKEGGWRDVTGSVGHPGPDVWSATGTSDQFEWLQIYPVYPYLDPVTAMPAIRLRASGAASGTSCTGTKLQKGDGEAGTCRNPLDVTFDWKHLKVVCRERSEVAPVCRGELILDYRNHCWGWFCAYGGPAIHACTAVDAPELDTGAFIPGKPWCMPAGASTFVGVCK